MERRVADRYTRFPKLSYGDEPVPSTTTVSWTCSDSRLDINALILSWASVLGRLASEDTPVFNVDREPISADLSTGRYKKAFVDNTRQSQAGYTEILTKESIRSDDGCVLEVRYCFQQRLGWLVSSGCTTVSYLEEIARQLKCEVGRRLYDGLLGNDVKPQPKPTLSISNPDPKILPGPAFLHKLLQEPGRDSNLAIDVLGPHEARTKLTYERLHTLSNRLASQVAAIIRSRPSQSKQDHVIPLFLPQCAGLYVSWLAVLKAGAAVCPLSLDAPKERINFIVNDVTADIVITQSDQIGKFRGLDRELEILTPDGEAQTEIDQVYKPLEISPENLAYVMYTSGSTGLPKGVGISHRAATQSILAHEKHIPQFRRFLQFAAPTFDVSVFEIFFPLIRGATLVGCERRLMLNDLVKVINELGVDAAELTPTVAGELLRARASAPGLKVLLTIGEMLTRHVVDEFGFSSPNDGILYGMYGPTEATIHCTIAAKFAKGSRIGNIGIPLDSVSAFVIPLDQSIRDELEILPCGQVGELAVGGPQIANCYLNRSKENKEAFVESKVYGRLYRTGDKARLHPNGELECLGRVTTSQIKLRGQRMELGEVESVLSKVPGIRNVVVGVVEGTLIAFVSKGVGSVSREDVRCECKRWLPKFMVPTDVIFMDELPRLPSGKVDRKYLEGTYVSSRANSSEDAAGFKNDLERSIARCAEDILGTSVHGTTSFAAVGLDSLKAIKIASALRASGVFSDAVGILEADTVSQIALTHSREEDQQLVIGGGGHDSITPSFRDTALNSIRSTGCTASPEAIVQCSPIQAAMVAETMRTPRMYSNWIELEFGYGIDIARVKKAFSDVAASNEILRSGFVEVGVSGSSHAQVVWSELDENCFRETAEFDYDMSFDDPQAMLNPLKVEFIPYGAQMRALVHIHHALYDGWSWEHILKDLADSLTGKPLIQRQQYQSFREYHATRITPDEAERSCEYWREHLEDAVPSTWPNFQERRDIPAKLRTNRRLLGICVSDLDHAASKAQVSRQTVFQAAFSYLLSTYLGTSDVTFGTVSSGRTTPIRGIEDIIGPCIATVPLRLDLASLRNVRDLISLIHNLNRKSLKHGFLPLRDIKKAAGAGPVAPLFDSLFVWQDTANDNAPPSAIVREVDGADFLEFTMSVEFEVRGDRVHAKSNFIESVIPSSQADIFLRQLEELVALFLRAPDLQLLDVNSHLPPSLLSIENTDYVKHDDLPSLAYGVERLVASEPDRVAIEFVTSFDTETAVTEVRRLTYAELDSESNKLANCLEASGISSGDLVSILLEKSPEFYISLLAVVKLGAGYVPITPQTPNRRINSIIREASCKLCITSSALSEIIEESQGVQIVDLADRSLEYFTSHRSPSQPARDNTAYTIFTSGSTGVPKGVLISHHNLQSNIAVLAEIYPHKDVSRLLQACSHAFDVSVFEIFYSWYRGMTLCATTNDLLFRDIEKLIRTLGITHLSLTPTVAALISAENVPQVEFLVTAGEAMTSKVLKDWAGRGLYQGYGPSETTNICTVKPNLCADNFLNNLGKPFKNTSAFVLDEGNGFSLVLRGGVGEFCFGGTQVGLGYLNMPELTQQKFIQHPEYGKLYRSGDFGRILPDGSLAFTGRRDDLVKLRGQRIELGEINRTILGSAAVKDCATMIAGDERKRSQHLVSFWVPAEWQEQVLNDHEQLSSMTQNLFDAICRDLPMYMVPSLIVPVASIPMTESGKIDKRDLFGKYSRLDETILAVCSRLDSAFDEEMSFSETESQVAEIVSRVTESPLGDIGRHSSFYRLGLDSISAITVSKQLRASELGQIDISAILKNDTVARLARIIENEESFPAAPRQSSSPGLDSLFTNGFIRQVISEADATGDRVLKVLPCTPIQEAMLLDSGTDKTGAYVNHLTLEIKADTDILKKAWDIVVMRHDILRTKFRATDSARFSFAQIVFEKSCAHWEEIETSSVEALPAIHRRECEFIQRGELAALQFVVLIEVDTGKRQLHLFVHHALYDAEGMERLLYEVEAVVLGHQLPPVVSYDLYLEQMVGANNELADRFWGKYLNDMPGNHLIVPRGRQQGDGVRGFCYASNQFTTSLAEIEDVCKKMSISFLSVLRAAWAKLIAHYSKTSDICFGEVFSCRNIPIDGAERIVGPCFNTLPMRAKMGRNDTNLDFMKNLQNTKADILPYQLTSLRRLHSHWGTAGQPLFDTLLLLQSPSRPLNEGIWKLVEETGDMDFPLVNEIIPNTQTGKVELYLHFDQTRIPMDDARMVLSGFVEFVRHILNYPSTKASDFSAAEDVPSFVHSCRSEHDYVREQPSIDVLDNTSNSKEWSNEALEVCGLLSTLSGIDLKKLDMHTTIFQLGLDSINAVQIAHRLRNSGFSIAASDVIEAGSIGGISRFIQGEGAKENRNSQTLDFNTFHSKHKSHISRQIGTPEAAFESVRPCTRTQSGMLAMFINSEGSLYLNTISLRSASPLDISRLKTAWATVIERHDILRTGFHHITDEKFSFAMVTYLSGVFPVPLYADSGETGPDRRKKAIIPSRLHEPPWFVTFEQEKACTVVHFVGLHALYDANSLELIFSDVSHAYNNGVLPNATPIGGVLGSILTENLADRPDRTEFWREFGKDVQATKFPDTNPRHVREPEVKVLSKTCSKALDSLYKGCRAAGITLQAAGQAAWARLLACYTGESNVTFGIVLSGRTMSVEAENVVFPCLATLPSNYLVDGSNGELLHRIMRLNSKLLKHQFSPLPQIQSLAGSESSRFDTLFVFQKLSSTSPGSDLWEIISQDAKTEHSVSIEVIPTDDQVEFCLTFRNDILPEAQAAILLEQFDWLLVDSIFCSDSDCGHPKDAHRSIVSAVPRKELKIASPVKLVHEFVEVGAQDHPSRTALEFATKSGDDNRLTITKWTYKEFNDEANRYANLLQQRGTSCGNLVGICFDKCPQAYFAILAVLKIGCAYVALDPGAPVARKQFILEDSGAKLLLCTSKLRPDLNPSTNIDVLVLDGPEILDLVSSDPPAMEHPIAPEATCYCLYTSGSTGTPKGCEITHDNVIQALLSFQRLFYGHWDDTSRWFQFASFHFDVSVLEQYWSWSTGICLTSCPRDILFEDMPGTLRELGITHIDLTPSLARLIHPEEVPSICRGVFITGGEQLKSEILEDWGKHRVIYNGYGPTEVTIGCTMLPRVSQDHKPSNIGPQFDNVSSFVLKPGSNLPVLRGGIGELCVSGPLVGRGYLNRPELTAEKFQFLEDIGERVYRTGDLVRMFHDESFSFLGRIDDQVKLRGQRLETEEINNTIRNASDNIGEVLTMVLKHSTLPKEQLVSFINMNRTRNAVKEFGIDFSVDTKAVIHQVTEACHASLPAYMVPTHIIPLTRFPLSANNKIDTRQLKDLYNATTLDEFHKLAPPREMDLDKVSNDFRRVMCIAAKATGADEESLSPASNIFELGLDSISVISFAQALKDGLSLKTVQPSLVMKNPTLSALVDALYKPSDIHIQNNYLVEDARQRISAFTHKQITAATTKLNISLAEVETVVPCTPLQEGIIYRKLQSTDRVYLSCFKFELDSSVDLLRLKYAWQRSQDNIQLLRSKFLMTDDGYALVVLKRDSFPWFEIRIREDDDVGTIATRKYEEWCGASGELPDKPWEVGVISGSTQKLMCLNIFHALYDGNSLPLILQMVGQAYSDTNIPETPSYTEMIPYGPLCKVPGAKRFWLQHLKPAKQTKFTPIEGTNTNGPTVFVLRIADLDLLESTRRKLNVTESAVVHACWLHTFMRGFNFTPTLGLVVSGRSLEAPGAERVVGPMFNTIPCYMAMPKGSTISDLATACHAYNVSSLPYQHTPLRDIMKWLGRTTDEPLFEGLFVFERNQEPSTEALWKLKESEAEADYPLAFEARSDGKTSLEIKIVAQANILTSEETERLAHKFRDTLHEFIRSPSTELANPDDSSLSNDIGNHDSNMNGAPLHKNGVLNGVTHTFKWTPEADKIQQEIADLAGVDSCDIYENTSILEVGLDSIDAIKLSSRLRKMRIKLPVSAIMNGRTIQAMMNGIASDPKKRGQNFRSLEMLDKGLRTSLESEGYNMKRYDHVFPATPLQESMLAEMISSDYYRYFNHDLLELEDYVDVARLEEACISVVREHKILRTSFSQVSDPELPFSFSQLVHPMDEAVNCWSSESSFQEDPDTVFEEERSRAVQNRLEYPPLNFKLVRHGGKRFLLISISHALYDGWSLNLLHEDIARAYHGQPCDRPSYDGLLEQVLNSSAQSSLQFWKGHLDGASPVPFPRQDGARGSVGKVHRRERRLAMPGSKVISFCRSQGVSPQCLGLTCWALVLVGYLRKLDVIFGTILSGRDVEHADKVMFPTMNSIAIRTVIHGTREEMLRYVQDTLGNIFHHQHFPLRKVKSAIGRGGRDLFDTLFIYQKSARGQNSIGERLYKSINSASDVEFPVCVEMEIVGESVLWRVACRDTVMGEIDTFNLLEQVEDVLDDIVEHPEDPTIGFPGDTASIYNTTVTAMPQEPIRNGGTETHLSSEDEWTPTELTIKSVLSKVANVPEVDIRKNTSLFHLGLDSISGIKVSSLLKKESIILPVNKLLRAGTIPNMARSARSPPQTRKLGLNGSKAQNTTLIGDSRVKRELLDHGIKVNDVEDIMLATSGQVYMLETWQNSGGKLFYPDFFYRIRGDISRQKLERCWNALIQHLPILRTVFLASGRHYLPHAQAVLKKVNNPIVWRIDLRNPGDRWHIERSPGSVPVTLYASQTTGETIIMLHIHHALYDAVSLSHIICLFSRLCSGFGLQGSERITLSDFIAFETFNSLPERRESFWRRYTSGIVVDQGRTSTDGGKATVSLYRQSLVEDVRDFEKVARKNGISIQALFLAIYGKIHANLSLGPRYRDPKSEETVVIGVYLANRSHSLDGLPDLVAPTLNLVPLCLRNLSKQCTVDLARQVQNDLQEIGDVQNSCASLIEINDWTGLKLDTFVNFLKYPEVAPDNTAADSLNSGQVVDITPIEEGDITDARPGHEETNGSNAGVVDGDNHRPETLAPTSHRDVYKPGLDIEAAVRGNGLDVGIFGASNRIDSDLATKVLEKVQQEISDLVDKFA